MNIGIVTKRTGTAEAVLRTMLLPFVTALLGFCSGAQAVESLSLLPIGAPVLESSKIIYKINFQFSDCGENYWWFYDSTNMQIVLEFYDMMILAQDSIALSKSLPVKNVQVRVLSTPLVISQQKSQVILSLRENMECAAECKNDTLQIKIWKELSPKTVLHQKKNHIPLVPILITGLSAAATFIFLYLNY